MSGSPFGRYAAWVYLALALPSVLLLLATYPNLHAPDDTEHVKRAYTLLRDPFTILNMPGRSSGAMIDTGIGDYDRVQSQTSRLPDLADNWPTAEERRRARETPWQFEEEYSTLPGGLSYFPALYAPQGLALWLGRSFDLPVATSIFLARMANALTGLLLTFLALRLLRGGHAVALVPLLLPRTLLQFASNSADPILFGLALLAISLGLRSATGARLSALVSSLAIFTSTAVRPPLAALAMISFGRAARRRDTFGAFMAAAPVLAAVGWFLLAIPHIVDVRCTANAGQASAKLQSFATGFPILIGQTLAQKGDYFAVSLIGHYGWGDGPHSVIISGLPLWVYAVALMMFAYAVRVELSAAGEFSIFERLLCVTSTMAMILLTFLSLYVTCSQEQADVVSGIQGRYFVPAFLSLAPALSGLLPKRSLWDWPAFSLILAAWVAACTATMVLAAPGLYRF